MCGEMIAATARKCRHCGEFLDGRPQRDSGSQHGGGHTTVVVQQNRADKSVAVALLLTFLFGPFGMFYSTPVGGLVMLGVDTLIGVLGAFTFGFGWLLFLLSWPVKMVWAAMAC